MAGRQQQTGLRSSQIQGRIKRIIQSDDDVGKVAAASTFIVGTCVRIWHMGLCELLFALKKGKGERREREI